MIVIISAFIGTYWVRAQVATRSSDVNTDGGGRNERSTPRSFILPATPAVALEQEIRLRKTRDKRQLAILDKCAALLSLRGFDVGDEMVSFNAKLVAAVYTYQERTGLPVSGRLNSMTRKTLGC